MYTQLLDMKPLKQIVFLTILTLFSLSAQARKVVTINDNWRFYFSTENSSDYARTISLPHTWSYNSPEVSAQVQSTTANYIREVYIPEGWSEKRIFVKFYGVARIADLLVNGRYVGEHRGSSTAFTFEITDHLKPGGNNRLHVVVNNAPQSDVLPTSQQEDCYAGIYRDVELIVTEKTVVSPLYYGSDGLFVETRSVEKDEVQGVARVHLSSTQSNNCQVALSIFDPQENIVFQKLLSKVTIGDTPAEIPFSLAKPQLWSLTLTAKR